MVRSKQEPEVGMVYNKQFIIQNARYGINIKVNVRSVYSLFSQ